MATALPQRVHHVCFGMPTRCSSTCGIVLIARAVGLCCTERAALQPCVQHFTCCAPPCVHVECQTRVQELLKRFLQAGRCHVSQRRSHRERTQLGGGHQPDPTRPRRTPSCDMTLFAGASRRAVAASQRCAASVMQQLSCYRQDLDATQVVLQAGSSRNTSSAAGRVVAQHQPCCWQGRHAAPAVVQAESSRNTSRAAGRVVTQHQPLCRQSRLATPAVVQAESSRNTSRAAGRVMSQHQPCCRQDRPA
eukprot:354670-Chlamydomonas_euryale.AAC.3